MRVGIGYDVHILTEGRKMIIGGVDIPYEKGLLGHSDADVLTHAVADALLGAAALGDIGQRFPDSDEKYCGISSLILLSEVKNLLKKEGYKIINIDSIIIAEKPMMMPYLPQMAGNLAEALEITFSRIGIKATTTEGLGFTGRKEGIAAQAVALIE